MVFDPVLHLTKQFKKAVQENIILKERVELLELANKNANKLIEEEVELKTKLMAEVEMLRKGKDENKK